jgi:hypothetical protein
MPRYGGKFVALQIAALQAHRHAEILAVVRGQIGGACPRDERVNARSVDLCDRPNIENDAAVIEAPVAVWFSGLATQKSLGAPFSNAPAAPLSFRNSRIDRVLSASCQQDRRKGNQAFPTTHKRHRLSG